MTNHNDIFSAWAIMRLDCGGSDRFAAIVRAANINPYLAADFMDGDLDGWEWGDDAQQYWLQNTSMEEIADWVTSCAARKT